MNDPCLFKPFICFFTSRAVSVGEELTFSYFGFADGDAVSPRVRTYGTSGLLADSTRTFGKCCVAAVVDACVAKIIAMASFRCNDVEFVARSGLVFVPI